jgi:hypothetical protein
MASGPAHELFSLDPNEFVAARDRLARDLRAAGDKEQAAAVKALRRPSVPLWALNRVAQDDAQAAEDLLAAAANARAAQDDVLAGGDGRALRDALVRFRSASAAVARGARQVIEASGRASAPHERDIDSMLGSMGASDELDAPFRAGELIAPTTEADSGDDLLAALSASVPDGPRPSRPARPVKTTATPRAAKPAPAPKAPEPSPRLLRARAELDQRRGEADVTAEAAREAARALDEAEAALDRARRELDAARRERDQADRAADRAARAVERAEQSVRRLS